MLHPRFIRTQITRSKKQAALFGVCVALSLSGIFALEMFSTSIDGSLANDARKMHAADIVVRSRTEISAALASRIRALETQGAIRAARIYEFYSMARSADAADSLLAHLKVVPPAYPFYGKVVLASGRSFDEVLAPGTAVVESSLLDRLHIRPGHTIKVGLRLLTVVDVVVREPDRPVSFYSLGPRVFIHLDDLASLDLVKTGSRISHRYLIQVPDPGNLNRIFAELKSTAADQERVDTFQTAELRIKRFIDNFLFFLGLIGIFTLLLAGIGIQSTLGAFLRENEKSIAILRTLGATSRFLIAHYLVIALVLGFFGALAGVGLGLVVHKALLGLFAGLLPEAVVPVVSWAGVLKGLALGLVVVPVFTFLPLHRIRQVKPNTIFRKEQAPVKTGTVHCLAAGIVLGFLLVMTLWMLKDSTTGALFVLGLVLLIGVAAGISQAVLAGLKKTAVSHLALRQALRGLFRPGNATGSIIVTLSASLTVLFSIHLIERNLHAAYIRSYPPDAANLFFIDIQPSQKDEFSRELGAPAQYHPIVRGRIVSINAETLDRQKERPHRGDSLLRTFNLTYRDRLLDDEILREGKHLFRSDIAGPQVSVLDTVQDMRKLGIGDRITFQVQGIPLTATVASIRSRTRESLSPFFYFVFPPEVLSDAPQTIFTALRVEKEKVAPLQNRMVNRFPNVSVIDISEPLSLFAGVLRKLSSAIGFFMSFGLIAGGLIIVSSLVATRFSRIREAVYFKILGARTGFVQKVFALENLVIGLSSAGIALLLSQTASLIITRTVLDIPYRPVWGPTLAMAGAGVCLIFLVGFLSSLGVLKKRPVAFLREQSDE